MHSLVLLYLGYGVIGGIGLGLGYVTPVTTVAKWFPDRKGLATGMVIMGFGLGALLMSKILAPLLIGLFAGNLSPVFYSLAGIFLVGTLVPARFMVNPPEGFAPKGAAAPAPAPKAAAATPAASALTAGRAILSGRFVFMWLVFFCNIAAGIAIISFQSPLFQDLWRAVDGYARARHPRGMGRDADRRKLAVQRRGPVPLGRRVRPDRPVVDVPGDARHRDRGVRRPDTDPQPLGVRRPRVLGAAVLRRRLRHHARRSSATCSVRS